MKDYGEKKKSRGVKMADCRFYVDEEEQVVVCVIPNTKDMLLDYVQDNFRWADLDMFWAIDNLRKDLVMPNSFMGKAVCSPDDEWDEDLGCLIAFSRAKDKCYKSFFRRANKLVQRIDKRLGDMIESFNDFGLKLEDKRGALQEQIDQCLKGE